jgi:PKD repeat protein
MVGPYQKKFGFTAKYKTALVIGEEGTFGGTARNGEEPYTFEWKFSDGVTHSGQIITRSFNSSGTYYFDVTVTDAEGNKVKSGNLSINVLQEMPKEEEGGTANATSVQHNYVKVRYSN